MRLHWTCALAPALAGLTLFAGTTAAASAAVEPARAPRASAVTAPVQDGADADAAGLDAAIDAEIADAIGSPAYAQLRMLVNSGDLPEIARATIAQLLKAGVRRAAPDAAACRRRAATSDPAVPSELAPRCREWLAAHADGPLALATCRRVAGTDGAAERLAALVERCRTIVAEYEQDPLVLARICPVLTTSAATTAPDDALATRCRELPVAPVAPEREDAAGLARCVWVAQFAVDPAALIDRCRALLRGGAHPRDTMRTLRAELAATPTSPVGAETNRSVTAPTSTTPLDGRVPARAAPGN